MKNFIKNHKKTSIFFAISIILILIYTIFGFFGVPWLIKSFIPSQFKDRNITLVIKDAKFNPYKFELNATDINLTTNSDLFSLKQLDVQMKFREIFLGNINIKNINLDTPSINIQRDINKTFNFAPFISSENKAEKKEKSKPFFNFTLDSLKINNGEVAYEDRSLNNPFYIKLKDIDYGIQDINLKENSIGKHELGTDSKLIKRINLNGDIDLNPLKIYGNLQIDGLQIKQIWKSYLKDNTDLNVTSGEVNMDIKYNISIGNGADINLKHSKIEIEKFNAHDKNNTKNIAFEKFSIPDLNLEANLKTENNVTLDIPKISLNKFSLNELELDSFIIDKISSKTSLTPDKISLTLNIKDQNLSSTKIIQNKNNISLSNLLLSDISVDSNDIHKSIDVNFSTLKLNSFAFNDTQIDLKNLDFFIKDANTSLKDSFKNVDSKISKFGITQANFNGFDMQTPKVSLNATNLNLNIKDSNISANLQEIKTDALNINSKNKKLAYSLGVEAKSINLNQNLVSLDTLGLLKTNVFSQNKPFAGVQDITLNDIKFDIKNSSLTLKDIVIKEPFFNSYIDKNGAKAINEIELLKPTKNKKSKNKNDSKFVANIQNIQILNAKSDISHDFLGFELDHKVVVENFDITNFSTDTSKPFGIRSNIKTDESISANISGKITLSPLNTDIKLDVRANDMSKLNKITQHYINGDIKSGVANFKGDLKLKKNINLNATSQITNLDIQDNNSSIIGFKELSTKSIKLTDNSLTLDDIKLKEPYLNAVISKDGVLNLSKFIKDNNNTTPKEEKDKKSDFFVSIDKFAAEDALIDFKDESLVLPFDIKLRKTNAQIDKIDDKTISSLNLQGIVSDGGVANIVVKTNLFEPKKLSDISVKFKDIDLIQTTPYTATFVGRKISNGSADLELKYDIKDSKMIGSNNIKIDTIKLGDSVESKRAMSLPLSLAISILQDSKNIINLNLPVNGDLSNPKFSYGGIVLKAVLQIFTDVATSPFRLLGNVIGISNSNALSSIDFNPGDDSFQESQLKKISDFKKITDTKPKIALLITPAYDEILDKKAIQKRLLDSNLNHMSNKKGISFESAIQEMAKSKFGQKIPENPYDKLIQSQQISKDSLDKLAKKRADKIKKEMLKAGIKENNIRIEEKIAKVKAQMQLYVPLPMGIKN